MHRSIRVFLPIVATSLLLILFQNCGPAFNANYSELSTSSSEAASNTSSTSPESNTPKETTASPLPNTLDTPKKPIVESLPSTKNIHIPFIQASDDDGNKPENTIDNDLTTRWSASGNGQYIILDTQKNITLTKLQISFYLGNTRTSSFHVEVSKDGKSFTRIASSLKSSGNTNSKETFNVKANNIQFVKIIGLGNSFNNWNSYNEVSLIGTINGPAFAEPLETPIEPVINACSAQLPSYTVNNFTELSSALNATKSTGGVIRLNPGNYKQRLSISGRRHTASTPLVIIGEGDSSKIKFDGASTGFALKIENSSYIQVENISLIRGWDSVIVNKSDHIIMKKMDLSQPKQAGFHIGKNSKYIDIINNKIYDTGKTNSHYGECIYIGTGSYQDFPDQTENIWISNNDISNCGHGEAVNIKTEVFNTTVANNMIYNIKPGSPTHSQYNQAAITVEGGRGSTAAGNHRPNEPRMVWVENNKIDNVSYGRWANAIMVAGTGVVVRGNELSRFQESGIFINQYNNLGSPVYLGTNTIDATIGKAAIKIGSGVTIIKDNLPVNNNAPQNWGCK